MELKTWKKTQISGTSITMLIIGRKKKHYGSYSTVHIHCHMSAFLPKLFRHCILYIQRFTHRYMYHEGSMYFQRSWFTKQLPVGTVWRKVFLLMMCSLYFILSIHVLLVLRYNLFCSIFKNFNLWYTFIKQPLDLPKKVQGEMETFISLGAIYKDVLH